MNGIKEKINDLIKKENRAKLVTVVGILILVLILVSELGSSCTKKEDTKKTETFDCEAYADSVEKRLCEIVGSIKGAGRVKVLVTLENSEEYIYASDSKQNSDSSEKNGTDGTVSTDTKSDSEESVIIVDGEKGREALVRTMKLPTVGGVVVVCDGAENEEVRERITEAVTTALGISSRRVYVTILTN